MSCEERLPHHEDFFFCVLPYKDVGKTFQESKENHVQWSWIIKSVASEPPLGFLICFLLFEVFWMFSKAPLLRQSAVRKSDVNFRGDFPPQGSSGSWCPSQPPWAPHWCHQNQCRSTHHSLPMLVIKLKQKSPGWTHRCEELLWHLMASAQVCCQPNSIWCFQCTWGGGMGEKRG